MRLPVSTWFGKMRYTISSAFIRLRWQQWRSMSSRGIHSRCWETLAQWSQFHLLGDDPHLEDRLRTSVSSYLVMWQLCLGLVCSRWVYRTSSCAASGVASDQWWRRRTNWIVGRSSAPCSVFVLAIPKRTSALLPSTGFLASLEADMHFPSGECNFRKL